MQKNKVLTCKSKKFRIILLMLFMLIGVAYSQSVLADVVIDNGDAGTTSTGIWEPSGATGFYGDDSVWSRDGDTYTWNFGSQPSGLYEILMWWTEWPSRSPSVPIDVSHASGTRRVYVNQQQNGGQWNSLGQFVLAADADNKITVTSQPFPTSTNADAVWFRFISSQVPTEIIIDNHAPETSSTGLWETSGAFGPYDMDSVWSRDGTTFSWFFTPPESGNYEFSMWWTQWSSRSSSVPVVIENAGQTDNVIIDQLQNGSQWNVIDTYYFESGQTYEIMITAQPGPSSTCADAVKFKLIDGSVAPTAYIDSISPNPANVNQQINFIGHGTDADGTIVTYKWESDIDGILNDSNSFSHSFASEGTHTISLSVQDDSGTWSSPATSILNIGQPQTEIIIDNLDAATSKTGTWEVSGGPDPYGTESVWSRDGDTFTWHFTAPESGQYELFMWWTQWPSRSASVPVQIETADQTETVIINQQQNGGQWNSLGNYNFEMGQTYDITVTSQPGPSSTCADAIRLNLVQSNDIPVAIVDSITPNPAALTDTVTFVGHGQDPQGGEIVAYSWRLDLNGYLSDDPNFTYNAAVFGKGVHSIHFSVQNDLGQWSETVTEQLIVENAVPTAYIDTISPNPGVHGQNISFSGHGEDLDGTIEENIWESSIDGVISNQPPFTTSKLSYGTHIISLRVVDDYDDESEPATAELFVNGSAAYFIIDNQDQATSSTGIWEVSGGPDPYGTESVWSRDGDTFSWHLQVPSTGYYEIKMWWTEWPSRSSSVPVDIHHSGGTNRLYVNQQQNGGQWNSLGVYMLQAGTIYDVTVISQPGPSSTCADAIRCSATSEPQTPVADFTAAQTHGASLLSVQFTDQSTGVINTWLWDFGDGQTSSQRNPQHTYYTPGTYDVSLTVTSLTGTDVETKQMFITVLAGDVENIYLCATYSGGDEFIPNTTAMLRSIGAVEDNGVYVYERGGITYRMHFVKTPEAMRAALREQNSHVIIAGHANFGFGSTFANSQETLNQRIDDIYYVDDDRFVNFSTDMVSTKVDGMKYGQAYPNWEPIFKNGQSAIMPYTFAEGTPPYNYYLTYNIPGDPMTYKIELSNGEYLERFPDASTPVWYSPDGSPPDPIENPEYFIVNNDADFNRCTYVGSWPIKKIKDGGYTGQSGYLGYNYQVHWPGMGYNKAIWNLVVKYPGLYTVMASWYPDPTNATDAPFTVHHAGGIDVVDVNQRTTNLVNVIGTYYFNEGSCQIELSDNANGQVVADAMVLSAVANPLKILQSEFDASVTSGDAPLSVQFDSLNAYYSLVDPVGDVNQWHWDFGDGTSSTAKSPLHVYYEPGQYDVTLTVTGPSGSDTETEIAFVQNIIGLIYADNVDRTKPHYYSRSVGSPITFGKVICDTGDVKIPEDELGYYRMFNGSCNSFPYYAGTFHRGIMFAKTTDVHVETYTATTYLEYYLLGYSDQEILQAVNAIENNHEYYNFNLKPPSMR